jgi:predicted transcriptional regulator of viral defense system
VKKQSTLLRLAEYTRSQWGLITRSQARIAGISPSTIVRISRSGELERIAQGVYLVAGSPRPDYLELRAAYLQLAPEVPVWKRSIENGVVSHRSAAVLYGFGHLPADVHEFTFSQRRQTRIEGVRLHCRPLKEYQLVTQFGMFVTRPSRIVADLIREYEDLEAIAQIAVDAIDAHKDDVGNFILELCPVAARLGESKDDGRAAFLRLAEESRNEEFISQISFLRNDNWTDFVF